MRFAAALDPAGIELFEQPCDSRRLGRQRGGGRRSSTVPLMLDEPICTLDDIDRAAGIPNVRFCKLKLKRFGSLGRLHEGLQRACAPVAWSRCLVMVSAARCKAGWKPASRATTITQCRRVQRLPEAKGSAARSASDLRRRRIRLPAGYRPALDRAAVERFTTARLEFYAERRTREGDVAWLMRR